jgi:hypothetical protein
MSFKVNEVQMIGDALWYSYEYVLDTPVEHRTGHGTSICRKGDGRCASSTFTTPRSRQMREHKKTMDGAILLVLGGWKRLKAYRHISAEARALEFERQQRYLFLTSDRRKVNTAGSHRPT